MVNITESIEDNKLGLLDEWLDTNSLGSYASGSTTGSNHRKYHGLLLARQENFEDKFM